MVYKRDFGREITKYTVYVYSSGQPYTLGFEQDVYARCLSLLLCASICSLQHAPYSSELWRKRTPCLYFWKCSTLPHPPTHTHPRKNTHDCRLDNLYSVYCCQERLKAAHLVCLKAPLHFVHLLVKASHFMLKRHSIDVIERGSKPGLRAFQSTADMFVQVHAAMIKCLNRCMQPCLQLKCSNRCMQLTCSNRCMQPTCSNRCMQLTCLNRCMQLTCSNRCMLLTCSITCMQLTCWNRCMQTTCLNRCMQREPSTNLLLYEFSKWHSQSTATQT